MSRYEGKTLALSPTCSDAYSTHCCLACALNKGNIDTPAGQEKAPPVTCEDHPEGNIY